MKILITAGKSAIALKMLKAFGSHQKVLADYDEMPNFSSEAYKFLSLGKKNEDTIAHMLLNHSLNEEVDLILPLHAFEVVALAKAKVLFSEFNIEILLPVVEDLSTYTGLARQPRALNWAIFQNGNALFMSVPNEQLGVFARNSRLNGAFYFNDMNPLTNLTLITI